MSLKSQLLEIANDLDMHSFSANDGYVGRKAAEIEAIAELLEEEA